MLRDFVKPPYCVCYLWIINNTGISAVTRDWNNCERLTSVKYFANIYSSGGTDESNQEQVVTEMTRKGCITAATYQTTLANSGYSHTSSCSSRSGPSVCVCVSSSSRSGPYRDGLENAHKLPHGAGGGSGPSHNTSLDPSPESMPQTAP